MPLRGKLVAWITLRREEEFLASIVGGGALPDRAPATQLCSSSDEARQWIEDQAAALGLPVAWMSEAPRDHVHCGA
jgi:hypothetical protein